MHLINHGLHRSSIEGLFYTSIEKYLSAQITQLRDKLSLS